MSYVHGYSERETQRLTEQSFILEKLLHSGTNYPAGSKVLEAGCGVGAQSYLLSKRNPHSQITSIDISHESLSKANSYLCSHQIKNIKFIRADIMNTGFSDAAFDHIFVCFVLEHLSNPVLALKELKRVLKSGGSITVIEGDHGSCFWHPETRESIDVWNSLIIAQQKLGHDPLIGRKLHPLLQAADFEIQTVEPRWVYSDASNQKLADGVLNKIIVPMVASAKKQVLNSAIVSESTWNKGLSDLEKTACPPEGTFFYTWFKGIGIKR